MTDKISDFFSGQSGLHTKFRTLPSSAVLIEIFITACVALARDSCGQGAALS